MGEQARVRVDFSVPRGGEELLPAEIFDLCGNGFWLSEAKDSTQVTCYPPDAATLVEILKTCPVPVYSINTTAEDPQDYSELTRRYFRPIQVEGLTILPPWRKNKKPGLQIIIDPGMAFGTGRHESTRLMIRLMGSMDFTDKTVLDLGCGSAVLSLYARLLGARSVLGVDNDFDAAASARHNVALNKLDDVTIACAHLSHLRGAFDVVLANLDIRTFTSHGAGIADLVRPGGHLVVSGILGRDSRRLVELLGTLTLLSLERKNSWRGFLFRKETDQALSPRRPSNKNATRE